MNIEQLATPNPAGWVEQDIQTYLASDGQDNTHPAGENLILLYTTGRKTGEVRRVALGSIPGEDGNPLVMASNGGNPKEPMWYLNLLANDNVWVRKQADLYEAKATVLPLDERTIFWDDLSARMPVIDRFQEQSGRETPVLRLTRAEHQR